MVTNMLAAVMTGVVAFNAVHQVQPIERSVTQPVNRRVESGTVTNVVAACRPTAVETVVNPLKTFEVSSGVVGVRVRV